MGSICGPSVANIFVYVLEKHWLGIEKPLIYVRFIDDIYILMNKKLDYNNFKNQFLNLVLNIVEADVVNFLDLNISYDQITCKLNFSLYTKPTNTFSYLLTNSNHPNFIFKNIPKSLFIRIRRICTSYSDYLFHSRKLINQLTSRGYSYKTTSTLMNRIGNVNRDCLLPYKLNNSVDKNRNIIWFNMIYNNNISNQNTVISSTFNNLALNNHSFFSNSSLKIFNSISSNLSAVLMFKHRINKISTNFTKPCLMLNCKTCSFTYENSFLLFKNNLYIPLFKSSNCISSNVIYLIHCKLCNLYYFQYIWSVF